MSKSDDSNNQQGEHLILLSDLSYCFRQCFSSGSIDVGGATMLPKDLSREYAECLKNCSELRKQSTLFLLNPPKYQDHNG